jgi:hypothetical protein
MQKLTCLPLHLSGTRNLLSASGARLTGGENRPYLQRHSVTSCVGGTSGEGDGVAQALSLGGTHVLHATRWRRGGARRHAGRSLRIGEEGSQKGSVLLYRLEAGTLRGRACDRQLQENAGSFASMSAALCRPHPCEGRLPRSCSISLTVWQQFVPRAGGEGRRRKRKAAGSSSQLLAVASFT